MLFDPLKFGAIPTTAPKVASFDASKFGAVPTVAPAAAPAPAEPGRAPGDFSVKPLFPASEGGNPAIDVAENTLKTFGNIPSSAANVAGELLVKPGANINESLNVASDIYKARGLKQGTLDILQGFADTGKAIFKAPGEYLVNKNDQMDLEKRLRPMQEEALKVQDEIYQKLLAKKEAGQKSPALEEALRTATENVNTINAQIGTKEERYNQILDAAKTVAKIGIEDPTLVPLAAAGGENAAGKDLISSAADTVLRGADTKVSTVIAKIAPAFSESAVKTAAEDWSKLGNDYVRSSKILAKGEFAGKDAPQFLADRGISPSTTQAPGERIALAERITKQDTQPFEDVLQRTLKEVDQGQEPISIADIEAQAIGNIERIKGLTALDAENMSKNISDEFGALKRKYGDRISLENINKEKRTFWQNTKFDSTKPYKGDMNYQIGNALKTTIENNVADVNIKELNDILAQHYDAGKFLNSVDGKLGKATVVQKVKKAAVRVAATTIGHAVGGTIGGVSGFLLTDSINAALSKASSPLKTFFLNRLKNTDPGIYEEYINGLSFLEKQAAERASRLALPPASPLGTPENPIVTPAPAEAPMKVTPAKSMIVRDPKTGRMKKVYTSEGITP